MSVNYSPEFDDSGPNLNLLRRLAELGGGKVLDPVTDNPFLHDREKTFRPFDLRDWLLRLAIILFPLDVAVRRIQLDRAEWLKATATLRRWLLPWTPVPRPKDADESLSALLSRRDQVRSRRPTAVTAAPDLFQPRQTPRVPEPAATPSARGDEPAPAPPTDPAAPPAAAPEAPVSTTSRLLDAKRRARKRSGE